MKDETFYGKGVNSLKKDYPDVYELVTSMSDVLYDGKSLDYKTQKLIAIGIIASKGEESAIKQQILSGMKELDITKDEIMDVLKIVLLTSGMPSFNKAVKVLNNI